MASIAHDLFSWQALESSSQIQRLALILEAIDDEALMRRLEALRRGRRNDNPQRAMWNSLIAGLVFGHGSIESLRRELGRNAELRQVCGFPMGRRTRRVNGVMVFDDGVPSAQAYSRFIARLGECLAELDAIFESLVDRLGELLPDFGRHLAADGKAIAAARRDDADAAVGVKRQGRPDGDEQGEATARWFGYKLHMVCDATHELPVAFKVTNAAEHESPHLMDLVARAAERTPEVAERAETLCADRGYDDGADKAALYDDYGIEPIVPARDLTDGRYTPLDDRRHDTIYISPTGQVSCCVAPFEPEADKRYAPMYYDGFEPQRRTLKFRCPAATWGLECHNRAACQCSAQVKHGHYGRVVRVSIDRDARLFGPRYAHSAGFQDLYKMRTAVERLFFRFDHMYGFERHHARGLMRMRVRVSLALIAMQANAVGWIEAGRARHMRRLHPVA